MWKTIITTSFDDWKWSKIKIHEGIFLNVICKFIHFLYCRAIKQKLKHLSFEHSNKISWNSLINSLIDKKIMNLLKNFNMNSDVFS